jgi:Glycosyl hydrolase catalytic core
MVIKKRCLPWDWTNTQGVPQDMDKVNFNGPLHSVSNWNTWVPPELKNRAPFRPMVRTEGQLNGADWNNIESTPSKIIHFFNEPERQGITPEHAAQVWKDKMLPLRQKHGKQLVSPSCASDQKGQDWIHKWMNLVSKDMPNYLGLHYYGTDSHAAMNYLQAMHQKYPHTPIILSEFASISRNYNDVLTFTVQVVNWMDQQPYIFEFGLFGCMRKVADDFVSPQAQLMNPDGSFTDLMYKYMSDQPMHH